MSSQAFQGFNCDEVGGGQSWLKQDYAVACAERGGLMMVAEPRIAALVFTAIALYTITIPLLTIRL